MAGGLTFTTKLAQFFNEGRDADRHAVWRYAARFSTSREAGQVLRRIEWLHKADVTMTGVDEGCLAGRMMGAMRLGGEDMGKKWKAAAGATEDRQTICVFFEKKQRADGRCSFMDTH